MYALNACAGAQPKRRILAMFCPLPTREAAKETLRKLADQLPGVARMPLFLASTSRLSSRPLGGDSAVTRECRLVSGLTNGLTYRFLNLINTSPLSLRRRMLNFLTPA